MAILSLGHRCDWKDSSQGFKWHILVAIDYFTKWVEAASYSMLKAKNMAQFLETNIICWFGLPQEIISDNGSHLEGKVRRVMEEYGIEHHKSSPYWPQANGAIETTNKNVKNILAKTVVTYKDWADRTSIRASTGATPYSLVYGSEVVLPIEVEIQSLRVLVEIKVRGGLGQGVIWIIGFDRWEEG